MRKILTVVFCVLFFILSLKTTQAATFYVSTTSDGTGTVNSIGDPYPSVRTAVYAAFSHSDASSEVIIRGGTYNQSENIFQKDFTAAGKSVLIKPYPSENSYFYPTNYLVSSVDYAWRFVGPSKGISVDGTANSGSITLDGSNMLSMELTDNTSANARILQDKGLLQLTGGDFEISGLVIRNSFGRGIQTTNSTNVTIENNTIYNIKTRAIGGSGDNITIHNNTVHDAVLENYLQAYNQDGAGSNDPDDADLDDGCGGWAGAISTVKINSTTASTNITITNNTVYDNWGEGIIPFDSRYVEIRNNTVYNNYSVNMYVEAVQDAVVDSNYIYQETGVKTRSENTDCPIEPSRETYGISIANEALIVGGIPEVVAYTDKMVIANNLVVGGEASVRFWYDESNTASTNSYKNLLIAHNIFWKPVANALLIGCVAKQDSGEICTHGNSPDAPTNARFMNNLISKGSASYGSVDDPEAWTFSHNHWVEGEPTFVGITHTSSTTGDPKLVGSSQNAGDSVNNFKIQDTSPLAQSGLSTEGLVPSSIEIWLPDTGIGQDYFDADYSAANPSRGFHEQIPAEEEAASNQDSVSTTSTEGQNTQQSGYYPLCNAGKPSTTANLFEITTTKDSATLSFVPANNASDHLITYGVGERTDMYAVTIPIGYATGVVQYTIYDLSPGTRYSFSMRGARDCAAGAWSSTISAQTQK